MTPAAPAAPYTTTTTTATTKTPQPPEEAPTKTNTEPQTKSTDTKTRAQAQSSVTSDKDKAPAPSPSSPVQQVKLTKEEKFLLHQKKKREERIAELGIGSWKDQEVKEYKIANEGKDDDHEVKKKKRKRKVQQRIKLLEVRSQGCIFPFFLRTCM